MKRIAIILAVMLAGIIVFLENSSKRKRQIDFIPEREIEYDDVWWDN